MATTEVSRYDPTVARLRELSTAVKRGWCSIPEPVNDRVGTDTWLTRTWRGLCQSERWPLAWLQPDGFFARITICAPSNHAFAAEGVKAMRAIVWGADSGTGEVTVNPDQVVLRVPRADGDLVMRQLLDLAKEHLVKKPKFASVR